LWPAAFGAVVRWLARCDGLKWLVLGWMQLNGSLVSSSCCGEGDAGADGVGDEGIGQLDAESVLGSPAGAMRREKVHATPEKPPPR
jgi:hypothetical protein